MDISVTLDMHVVEFEIFVLPGKITEYLANIGDPASNGIRCINRRQ